jgi:hypothetical protein
MPFQSIQRLLPNTSKRSPSVFRLSRTSPAPGGAVMTQHAQICLVSLTLILMALCSGCGGGPAMADSPQSPMKIVC